MVCREGSKEGEERERRGILFGKGEKGSECYVEGENETERRGMLCGIGKNEV